MTVQLGLLLALGCAFATNLAFLWKQQGAVEAPDVDIRHPGRSAGGLFTSKWWTIGFSVALGAWVLHVAALALAPISLVQAVISGGLVFLAVLADRWFGFELGKREWMGVALTAIGLAFLGLTVQTGSEGSNSSYSISGMIAFEGAMIFLGALLLRHAPCAASPAPPRPDAGRRGGNPLRGVRHLDQGAHRARCRATFLAIISPWTLVACRRLDRGLLRVRARPAGGRGRRGDRVHLGVREPQRHPRRHPRVRRPDGRRRVRDSRPRPGLRDGARRHGADAGADARRPRTA